MIFLSIFFHTHPSTDFLVWAAFCYVSKYQICTYIISTLLVLGLQIIVFLDCIGYTLAFATILAKVWRLYYIFNNPTTKKKVNFSVTQQMSSIILTYFHWYNNYNVFN